MLMLIDRETISIIAKPIMIVCVVVLIFVGVDFHAIYYRLSSPEAVEENIENRAEYIKDGDFYLIINKSTLYINVVTLMEIDDARKQIIKDPYIDGSLYSTGYYRVEDTDFFGTIKCYHYYGKILITVERYIETEKYVCKEANIVDNVGRWQRIEYDGFEYYFKVLDTIADDYMAKAIVNGREIVVVDESNLK